MSTIFFKEPIVVIEIGNEWIKIVESRLYGRDRFISRIKFIRSSQDKGPIEDAISKIFKDCNLSKHAVVTYIPRHLVTVRILDFPSANPKEIEEMVNLQVGRQTPYSREEIVSAYKIVDAEKEGYSKAMLVIAHRNVIGERLNLLQKAGIETEKVALSTENVYNWFNVAYSSDLKSESQAIILLDIDSNYSDFIVIRKGKLVFTRNILIGAGHLLIEPEKWHEKFIGEIKHSIELYQNEDRGVKITRLFLSGAAKNIDGLNSFLGAELNLPTQITEPLKNIRIKTDASGVLEDEEFGAISISASLGMAVKHKESEIDLSPPELRIRKIMEDKKRQLTVMGVLFTSIVMIICILFLMNIYNKKAVLVQLRNNIKGIEEEGHKIEQMREIIDSIERRLDTKAASINFLYEVYVVTQPEVYLTEIDIDERKQMSLKGRASEMSDVFKFITVLESSPFFKNVKSSYITRKKEENIEVADFEIICNFENE